MCWIFLVYIIVQAFTLFSWCDTRSVSVSDIDTFSKQYRTRVGKTFFYVACHRPVSYAYFLVWFKTTPVYAYLSEEVD